MDEERTGTPTDGAAHDPRTPDFADDTAATSALSGETEQPTRVMPSGEEPTRVMPGAAPPLGPPPRPPQPTVTMERRPSSGHGWWWIIAALVVAAVVALVWLFLLRADDGVAGQDFVGTWMPADASGGGLVIKQNGDAFTVTAYDAQIQPAGSGEAELADGRLRLRLPAQAFALESGGSLDVTIAYVAAQDSLQLVARDGATTRVTQDYVRTDVLQPAPAPAPTAPAPSPTPTPTPSTTGSPTVTADQVIIAGLTKIQAGVVAWAANSNGVYPAPTEVTSTGGIAQYVDPWPVNPYTNQPMTSGASPGDFQYEQLDGGTAYKLTGYLGNNLTYTLP